MAQFTHSGNSLKTLSISFGLYHIFERVDLIELCKSDGKLLAFKTFSLLEIFIQKFLSFISRMIFSAIFFQIHLIHSIVLLSFVEMAKSNLETHKDKICIATFHQIQDIFINSLKTFFSSFSINPKSASLFSVF
ncbi:MAG: hypothetical protein LBQ24_07575 [Candidatus Peribacteria bacterium]|nr:hypothetical protein [Candidatus Peribacteria bacterium]